MEYAAALEEKSNTQAERIIELKARVDGQDVLTENAYFPACAVSTGAIKELEEIQAMMK